jgi:hypothetical protein
MPDSCISICRIVDQDLCKTQYVNLIRSPFDLSYANFGFYFFFQVTYLGGNHLGTSPHFGDGT